MLLEDLQMIAFLAKNRSKSILLSSIIISTAGHHPLTISINGILEKIVRYVINST